TCEASTAPPIARWYRWLGTTPRADGWDPELLHAVIERRALDPEPRGRPVRTCDDPARSLQHSEDVRLVHGCEIVAARRRDFRRGHVAEGWNFEGFALSQNHRVLQDILQLANVAGPIVLLQALQRRLRNVVHVFLEALAHLAHEMFDEHR